MTPTNTPTSKCCEKPAFCRYVEHGGQCHNCGKQRFQNEVVIVPSGRIDWCGDCQAEHGYDCPKDTPTTDSKNSSEDWEKELEKGMRSGELFGRVQERAEYVEKVKDFIRREIQEERRKIVEFIRAKTSSERRPLRIGENELAAKQLNISMEEIRLHNSHCDGYGEGWRKKTEQVNGALEAALEIPS